MVKPFMEYLDTNIINQIPKGETHHDVFNPAYYEKLKQNISQEGISEPLVLQYYVKDNALRLIEGHHRLKLANELGIKKIPIKIMVNWNGSIINGNNDISGQQLFHPPKPLDIESYKRRNYQPSNITLEELGFNSMNESKNIFEIIKEEIGVFTEDYNHNDYLKWKRKNVTLRGIRDNNNSADNGGMAKYGQGLYTAFLGNKEMARQYGKVYYVVNAIPKNPKVVYNTNDAEIFEQQVVTNFCKMRGVPRSNEFFNSKTTFSMEMQRLGYDGLIIKGREMVNYNPPPNVLYFNTEQALINYYETVIGK